MQRERIEQQHVVDWESNQMPNQGFEFVRDNMGAPTTRSSRVVDAVTSRSHEGK